MLLAKCRAVSVVVSWVRSKMGIKKSKKPHKTSLERNPSKESICEQGPAFRRKTTRGRSVTEKWGHGSNIIFMTMQGFMKFVLSGNFTLNIHLGDIARYTSWVVLFLSVKAESQGASHARSEERTFQAEGIATEQAWGVSLAWLGSCAWNTASAGWTVGTASGWTKMQPCRPCKQGGVWILFCLQSEFFAGLTWKCCNS